MKPTLIACMLVLQLAGGVLADLEASSSVEMQVSEVSNDQIHLEIANKTDRMITVVEPNTERTSAAVSLALFDASNRNLGNFVRPFEAWQDGAFLPVIRIKPGAVHRFTVALGDFNIEPLRVHAPKAMPSRAMVLFDLRTIGLSESNGFFDKEIRTATFAVRIEQVVKAGKTALSVTASNTADTKAKNTSSKSPAKP